MLDQNYDSVLYQNSPFVPPVTIQSAFNIQRFVQSNDYPPSVAIAKELRDLFGEHLQFLESQMDWIVEKFNVSQQDMDDYYFGLLVPVTLMIATHMARHNRLENVLNLYFPLSEDPFFDNLRSYGCYQLYRVEELLSLETAEPMSSAGPIYAHCQLEVFAFSYWYQVGLEAGLRTFQQYARLH